MNILKIVDLFWRVINSYYYKVIYNSLPYLPGADKREITEYLLRNKRMLESYLGKTDPSRITQHYIPTFASYSETCSPSVVYKYIEGLKDLDRIIEEIRKNGHLPLPKHNNVTKPNNYYIEISFYILGDSQKRKDTLINVFKIIGELWARGYPVSYYDGTDNSPIIYYMDVSDDGGIYVRFFVKKLAAPEAKGVPPEVVGYLLYRLSRLPISSPANDGHGFIISRMKIDKLPEEDQYVSEAISHFRAFKEFL